MAERQQPLQGSPPSFSLLSHNRPPQTPPSRPPSSESARLRILGGQLTLHEYRKQQLTPSPPAVKGTKTLKRKTAVVNLSAQQGKQSTPPPQFSFPFNPPRLPLFELTGKDPPTLSNSDNSNVVHQSNFLQKI